MNTHAAAVQQTAGAAPLVSVIMPLHNEQQLVLDTLVMVLSQDLYNIEVICVDDGSTDSTPYIVEELARTDERLRLVHQQQAGPAAARNCGINQARGSFITFLDADDWYEEPSYLRTLYTGAVAAGVPAAGACFVNWRGPKNVERSFTQDPHFDGYEFVEEGVVNYADYQFDFGFHRFMFSATLFEDDANRFPNLRFFEDPVFLARILHQAGQFFATNKAHYMYRVGAETRRWTTSLALDLMSGVLLNLQFSHEQGLAKLHYYTLHHFDFFPSDMCLGINPHVSVRELDKALPPVQHAIDHELLKQAGEPNWLSYVPAMRVCVDEALHANPAQQVRQSLRYLKRIAQRTMVKT